MGTHPIFESDFDCLTEKKMRFTALRRCKPFKTAVRGEAEKIAVSGETGISNLGHELTYRSLYAEKLQRSEEKVQKYLEPTFIEKKLALRGVVNCQFLDVSQTQILNENPLYYGVKNEHHATDIACKLIIDPYKFAKWQEDGDFASRLKNLTESEYLGIDGNLTIVESSSKYRHENKRRAIEIIEEVAEKGESGLIRGMTVRKNGYHKRTEAREKSISTFQSKHARSW